MGYIPKHVNVYLPSFELEGFEFSPEVRPEVSKIMKSAWAKLSKWMFMDEKKTDAVYAYHRGPLDLFGDHGYIRAGAFITLYLHSLYNKEREIWSYLPIKNNSIILDKDLKNATVKDIESDLSLNETVREALRFFYNSEVLNQRTFRNYKLDDVKLHINNIIDSDYLKNKTVGASLFNILKFTLKLMRLLWLTPNDDGNTLKVEYKIYNLFDVINSGDYRELFTAWVLMKDSIGLINKISELSLAGRSMSMDFNGVQLSEEFFSNWTDQCISIAVDASANYTTVQIHADDFFKDVIYYSNLVRVKQFYPDWIPNVVKIDNNMHFTIFEQLIDVDVSESTLTDFVQRFDNYKEFVALWDEFIDYFFTYVSNDDPFLPNLTAYATELGGVLKVYGIRASSPYANAVTVLNEYQDGLELDGAKINVPFKSNKSLIITDYVEQQNKGVHLEDLESISEFINVRKRHNRYLDIARSAPSSTIIKLSYRDDYDIVVPPINPVASLKFSEDLLSDKYGADAEVALIYNIALTDLQDYLLPFVVHPSVISSAYSATDSSKDLEEKFLANFYKSLNHKFYGYNNFVINANIGRAAVMSLAALLATSSLTAAEHAIRYIDIKVDRSPLEDKRQGSELVMEKDILIPFPYCESDSTSSQRKIMEDYFNKKEDLIYEGLDSAYAGRDFIIDRNSYYSPFSDRYLKGLVQLRIGRNTIVGKNKLSAIDDLTYRYNVISMVDDYDIETVSKIYPFNLNEMDFIDPFPSLNAYQSCFQGLVSVVSDILLNKAYISNGATNINYYWSANILKDIYRFLQKFSPGDDTVHFTTGFNIDVSWKTVLTILESVIDICDSYLEAFSKSELSVEMIEKFENAVLDMCTKFRNDAPVFWSESGFLMDKLYFGDFYEMLNDKLHRRIRRTAPNFNLEAIRFLPSLQVNNKNVMNILKNHVGMNYKVLMLNSIGKFIYRSNI